MVVKRFGNLYFDTNVLESLSSNIYEDPRLVNLQKMALGLLKMNIFIPQIVLDEFLNRKLLHIRKKLAALLESKDIINKHTHSKIEFDFNQKILEQEAAQILKDNIKKSKISVFANPAISVDEMVVKAINRVKPFGEKGKGFQDMVILQSIIKHCSNNTLKNIFVTFDKNDFNHKDVVKTIKE